MRHVTVRQGEPCENCDVTFKEQKIDVVKQKFQSTMHCPKTILQTPSQSSDTAKKIIKSILVSHVLMQGNTQHTKKLDKNQIKSNQMTNVSLFTPNAL